MTPREFDEWRAYYAVIAEEREKAEKMRASERKPPMPTRSRNFVRGRPR